jgi:hypothetical protein
MKENIYLKSLEIGYDNLKGISFEQLKKELNDDLLKDEYFEFHFNIWFYNNFFHEKAEYYIVRHNNFANSSAQLQFENWSSLKTYNNNKSFLKGDSVSKYIDYLELKHTKETSITAKKFSIISIIIATLAVITPFIITYYFPPSPYIIITNERNDTTKSKPNDSDSLKFRSKNMIYTKSPSTDSLKKVNPKTNSDN